MTSTDRLPFRQCADIHRTDRFISVEPLSGYRMVQREDEGYVIYLAPDAVDEELGQALLAYLDKSRFIWPPDEPQFFEWPRYMQLYRNRQQDVIAATATRPQREAYKNMDWCRQRSDGKISIRPHKRDKPEYWRDLPPERTVVIPATPDAAAAGAALRWPSPPIASSWFVSRASEWSSPGWTAAPGQKMRQAR